MNSRLIPILMTVILAVLLAGCYDASEVDDITHVLAMGIDRGVSDKWRLTVQFSTIQDSPGGGEGGDGGGGGSGQSQGDYTHMTVDAPSFFAGLDMLNSSIPRELSFTHLGLIAISEDLAREGLMADFIAPLIRYKQIRGSTPLMVIKGSALDFIRENKPYIGTVLSKAMQISTRASMNIGFFGHTTLGDFYSDLKSTYRQPVVPIGALNDFKTFREDGPKWGDKYKDEGEYLAGQLPRYGVRKIEYWGTALFSGEKMLTELNGTETRALLMLRGEFKRGFFTVQDPKKPELIIPLDIRPKGKPKVRMSFKDGIPNIDITVPLKGTILAIQSGLHYEQDPLLSLLEKTFEKETKSEIDQLINKCKGLNLDVFKFGDVGARYFATIQEWEKYNWNSKFKDAKINTQVEFVIQRTGTRTKTSPIPDRQEE